MDRQTDGCYQEHYLPASLGDPVNNQFGVSFDKDFALLGYDDTVYKSEQCRTASITAQINTDQNCGIDLKNLSMLIIVEECGTKLEVPKHLLGPHTVALTDTNVCIDRQ